MDCVLLANLQLWIIQHVFTEQNNGRFQHGVDGGSMLNLSGSSFVLTELGALLIPSDIHQYLL